SSYSVAVASSGDCPSEAACFLCGKRVAAQEPRIFTSNVARGCATARNPAGVYTRIRLGSARLFNCALQSSRGGNLYNWEALALRIAPKQDFRKWASRTTWVEAAGKYLEVLDEVRGV